jgi:hypothetical protein
MGGGCRGLTRWALVHGALPYHSEPECLSLLHLLMRCCSDCSCAHTGAIKQAKTGECIVFESRVPEHVVGTVLEIVHVWAGSAHVIHDFTALHGRLFRRAQNKDCKLA